MAPNRLAREVLTDFDALPAPHRNLARYYLLHPEARARVGDWERIAAETVAILRLEAGRYPNDRLLADLVGELTLRSPEFTTWWNDHRVLRRTHGTKLYHHPLVGDLSFSYESFQVPGDVDQSASTTSSPARPPPRPFGSCPTGRPCSVRTGSADAASRGSPSGCWRKPRCPSGRRTCRSRTP
ncbi:MmyB family transcriptional regulator [Streptomyces sp. NPDC054794]